jgi:signal transduction histidine kinase
VLVAVLLLAWGTPCPSVELRAQLDTVPLAGRGCWQPTPEGGADDAVAVEAHAHEGALSPLLPGQVKLPRSERPVWLRYELNNIDHPSATWVLELWTVPTDEAELFVLSGGRMISRQRVAWPPTRSYHPLEVEVPAGQQRTALLRVRSSRVPVAPIAAYTPAALAARDHDKQLVMGLFFGIGAALIIYNLFLYVSLRVSSYLVYVLYAASMWLLLLGENGLVDVYGGGAWPRWSPLGTPTLALTVAAALGFSRVFLGTSVSPRLRGVLQGLLVACVLAAALALWPPARAWIGGVVDLLALAAIMAMVSAAVSRARVGDRAARIYLLAWSALFVPVLAWLAEIYGLIGQSALTRYAGELGVSLEMLLMSLALAEKLSEARRAAYEAARSHAEALELLIADQAEVNRQLVEVARRAQEASALKSAFLTKVGHELRTPLNHVVGLSQLLLEAPLGPDDHALVGDVSRAGQHLASMVDRLMELSQLEGGGAPCERLPVDVAALAAEVVASRRGQAAARGLTLELVLRAAPGLHEVDALRLRRVLLELVDNALRFTERGVVRVSVIDKPGGELCLEVMDSGPGLPPSMEARLFEVFSQADERLTRAHEGLGIGLALVQRIVAHLGGELGFDSRADLGTTFWVILPLTRVRRAA